MRKSKSKPLSSATPKVAKGPARNKVVTTALGAQPPVASPLVAALQTRDTFTENGALSNSSTGKACLDLFGKGGAMRRSSDSEVLRLFAAAYQEDRTLALKTLFYLADARGGQGERRLFRLCFRWLASADMAVATKLLDLVPIYRRWDCILESLDGTPLERAALSMIGAQLRADMRSERPSLAGKWSPSENASSRATRALGHKLRSHMGISSKEYRQMLSTLRARLQVVECQMCAGEWGGIDYARVPSRASSLYKGAFNRHSPERYKAYLQAVEKGEAKVNASVLYPYDIVRQVGQYGDPHSAENRLLEAQWKALPDYLAENPHSGLVVADVSGSMTGGSSPTPIEVCLSLAIYMAERNKGPFHNSFITFSERPVLQKLVGTSLTERLANLRNADWGMNTDLQAVFRAILDAGMRNKVAAKDMPSVVYIVSDMQLDVAVPDNQSTNLDVIRDQYSNAGYRLPRLVFWNVRAGGDVPVTVNDKGVCLVSGASPAILKTVLAGKVMTPLDVLKQTVCVERYAVIQA